MKLLWAIFVALFLTVCGQIKLGYASPTNGAPNSEPGTNATTAVPTSVSTTTAAANESTTHNSSVSVTTAQPTTMLSSTVTKASTSTTEAPKTSATTKHVISTLPPSLKPTAQPGVTTTAIPGPTTPDPFSKKGGHFDGLSFMSGIVASVCILGLAVLSYKFYKIRTERSYHTL